MNTAHGAASAALPHGGEVRVWQVGLTAPHDAVAEFAELLSPDERERAEKFRFERDRARYIIAHAALRQILARATGQAPAALVFSSATHGKPELDGLHFNLSHSGDLALVAVSTSAALGVDVERIREAADLIALARRFFSPPEVEDLVAAREDERRALFFMLWTRKEAFIKATGHGLNYPLNAFDTGPARGDTVRLLGARPEAPRELYSVASFIPTTDYAAAVAIQGRISALELVDWEP